jgi:hypothetical protein
MRICECEKALASALITDRARIPQEVRDWLRPITGKYLG